MRVTKSLMILGLISIGAGTLVMAVLNGFDGVQALAGAACFWVAAKGIA